MIVKVKDGEVVVAEIIVSGRVVNSKLIVSNLLVRSFVDYLTRTTFLVEDPRRLPALVNSRLGENGDEVSFIIVEKFGRNSQFKTEVENAPILDGVEFKEGVVF